MTLKEIYTDYSTFSTKLKDAMNDYYGSFPYENELYLNLCAIVIFNWYKNNECILPDNDEFPETAFIDLIITDFASSYYTIEKKLIHYASINNETLFNRSKLDSISTLTPNITSNNFTKQSSTPTMLEPSSSFVDEYTDYQSNSKTTRTGNEVKDTTITRGGSQEDALKVLSQLPMSLFTDIINSVRYYFITYVGD